jgi:hypothetical protein
MAFCPDCGNQMSPDAETCPSCGKGIDQAAAPVEAAAPAPPAPPAAGMAPPPAAPPPPMAPPPMAPPPPGQAFAPPPPGAVPPMGMGQPGPAWPAPVMAKKKTSGLAIASLVLAVLGFMCIPVLGPIIGLILGFSAKSQIKKSGGQLEGNGMATAGIVLSILGIIVAIVAAGLIFWAVNELTEPIDRTNEFINAVNAGDVDTAYGLLAPGTTTKAKLGDFVDEHRNSTKKHYAYASSINDDRAEVTVTFTDKDNYEYDEVFQLRNIDGEWKITYVPNW